jgi:hypothetical protein
MEIDRSKCGIEVGLSDISVLGKIGNAYEALARDLSTLSSRKYKHRVHRVTEAYHIYLYFSVLSVISVVQITLGGFFDLYRTHFVLGYLCRGVVGRIGKDVGASFSEVERHEHHPPVNSVGQNHLGRNLTPP